MDISQQKHRESLSTLRPIDAFVECEPSSEGPISALTVLLTAAECPIGCSMCDLWKNTLVDKTPTGSIPNQIDWSLNSLADAIDQDRCWIKLYNSGNFFDPRSTPAEDESFIAEKCRSFRRVIVENHPRIGKDRITRFRDLVDGQLEIAVGLETVQPRWLKRLGKKMTRDDFDVFARWLNEISVDLRVFLIVGVPGISTHESIKWAKLSAHHAANVGARHISFIPARAGHGWGGLANQLPDIPIDAMFELQQFTIEKLGSRCFVTVDLWDYQNSETCDKTMLAEVQRVNEYQGHVVA